MPATISPKGTQRLQRTGGLLTSYRVPLDGGQKGGEGEKTLGVGGGWGEEAPHFAAQMIKLNVLSTTPDFELGNESSVMELETVWRLLISSFILSMSNFSSLTHLLLFYLQESARIF